METESAIGIARPHSRARIETPPSGNCLRMRNGIARPHSRARIETLVAAA